MLARRTCACLLLSLSTRLRTLLTSTSSSNSQPNSHVRHLVSPSHSTQVDGESNSSLIAKSMNVKNVKNMSRCSDTGNDDDDDQVEDEG
mmetsp:Transcript_18240/g.36876  ORF Transcript_18240/g.36876 Transcript_18240/m.36876 type:complete len:89 (+) Transcript_18240:535-801(+)